MTMTWAVRASGLSACARRMSRLLWAAGALLPAALVWTPAAPASSPVPVRFGPPTAITRTTDDTYAPEVGLDRVGTARAVWSRSLASSPDAPAMVETAVHRVGQVWSRPAVLSESMPSARPGPQVGVSADGDAVAL